MKGPAHNFISAIARVEIGILLAIFGLIVGVAVFVKVADSMTRGDTQALDERLLLALRQPDELKVPIGPSFGKEWGRDFTSLGSVGPLAVFTAAVFCGLLLARQYRAALLVAIAAGGGELINYLLKEQFNRPRPPEKYWLDQVFTYSFPSGHSMLSAAIYLTLGVLLARFVQRTILKVFVVAMAALLVILIGFSRCYLQVHYPTDVLAGWSAGLAWAMVCTLLSYVLLPRKPAALVNGPPDVYTNLSTPHPRRGNS